MGRLKEMAAFYEFKKIAKVRYEQEIKFDV
jgi:hypothetical protein